MNALNQYAKHYIIAKAHEKICADLAKSTLREFNKQDEKKVSILGVEFTATRTVKKLFAKDIQACIDDYKDKIEEQKRVAKEAGKVKEYSTPAIKATIPKSTVKQILATVHDYAKYFGIK